MFRSRAESNRFTRSTQPLCAKPMCNNYRLTERVDAAEIFTELATPEGMPNFEPR